MSEKISGIETNAQILVSLFKKLDPLATGKRGKRKGEWLKQEIEKTFEVFKTPLENFTWKVEISQDRDIQLYCWLQDIYSIVTNLIENSIYWINKKNIEKKEIIVSIHVDGYGVNYIDYKDSGPGIEKHLIESGVIFEPEFSTKPEHGTGLGLSIAGEAARRCGLDLKALYSNSGAYFRLERLEDK